MGFHGFLVMTLYVSEDSFMLCCYLVEFLDNDIFRFQNIASSLGGFAKFSFEVNQHI